MKQGTYIRNVTGLKGERALIRNSPLSGGHTVLAQFNNMNLVLDGQNLANGWHEFLADSFEIDPPRYVLAYELKDDPGTEHEIECHSVPDACQHLRPMSDMVAWAELTDATGDTVADTSDLV